MTALQPAKISVLSWVVLGANILDTAGGVLQARDTSNSSSVLNSGVSIEGEKKETFRTQRFFGANKSFEIFVVVIDSFAMSIDYLLGT